VIPFRGDDMEWRDLRVMGDYGMVVPVPYSPRDEASIRNAIRGADVVINLAGKDYETTHYAPVLINYSFTDVNVTLAETIARISAEEVMEYYDLCVWHR
jgi:NADH dehydrogenase (ubiquinone) 1 alpha subcomplex subunit 9